MTTRNTLVKEWLTSVWAPALRRTLEQWADASKWKQWSGNHCRQAAKIGAWVLTRLLPDYDWRVFEGYFLDVVYGRAVKYDHAWNFGIPLAGQPPLFVDLGRVHHELVFRATPDNAYPTDGCYQHMRRLTFRELEWRASLKDYEYYTGIPGDAIALLVARATGLDEFIATLPKKGTKDDERSSA